MTVPWESPEVELPDALISALEADELVIFAGAGVSQGRPASLPDFYALADLLRKQVSYPTSPDPNGQLDVYLGDIKRDGHDVHDLARRIIDARSKRSNPIHRLLAELSMQQTPRIVTTNFDVNFERAFKYLGAKPETYVGPALPSGDNFDGLIHIHGSLNGNSRSAFVLTDSDFGEAYLTAGWATRFLVPMFAKYTVLFVGYSAGDVTMRYLTRSLPSRGHHPHFALVSEPELQKWAGLGIETIGYSPEKHHEALSSGLSRWLTHASSSVADHNRRIRQIVDRDPELISPDDERFLRWACGREPTLRLFVQHANSVKWMNWVDANELLAPVFGDSDGQNAGLLSNWLITSMATDPDDQLLDILRKYEPSAPRTLWNGLLWHISRQYRLLTAPRRYVDWILSHMGNDRDASHLLDTLIKEDVELAVRLIGKIIQLRRRVRPALSFFAHERGGYDLEFKLSGDEHALKDAWRRLSSQPDLELDGLADIALGELERATAAWIAFRNNDGLWDPLSGSRSAIEDHSQNYGHESFDIIIDIARDVIRQRARANPESGIGEVKRLLRRSARISKRFGLDALAELAPAHPDQALEILVSRGLVFQYGLKHEVFRVLKAGYPQATDRAKSSILHYAQHEASDQSDEELREYERFNLLAWLNRIDPSDEATEKAFEVCAEAHLEWEVREHPDFDSWHSIGDWKPHPTAKAEGRYIGAEYGVVLAERPSESNLDAHQRWLAELTVAANENPSWAWRLLQTLTPDTAHDDALLRLLLRAGASLSPLPEIEDIQVLLQNNPRIGNFWPDVEPLLEREFDSADERAIFRHLGSIYEVWKLLPTTPPPEVSLNWAINDPRGQAALLMVRLLSRLPQPVSREMLPPILEKLGKMLATGPDPADATTVILSSQASWLYHLDAEWTAANLLIQFDWDRDESAAAKAWTGFLDWGRWSSGLFQSSIVMQLQGTYGQFKQRLPSSMSRYIQHLAYVFRDRPASDGGEDWADNFLVGASKADRASWAREVANSLDGRPDESAAAWSRLKRYWQRRVDGLPIQLDSEEAAGMFEWAFLPGIPFDEAAELVVRGPSPKSSWRINRELQELPVANYPTESGRVIVHLLSGTFEESRWDLDEIIEVALTITPSDKSVASNILLKLGELGSVRALDLYNELMDDSA